MGRGHRPVVCDDEGRVYVVEAGYSYGETWTTPRLLRIEDDGKRTEIARGGDNGPWNGVAYHEGQFFVSEGGKREGGRILSIEPDGTVRALIENLPSRGDHHTNGPAVGPDGSVYFAIGTATNSGAVGEDNFKFGWLKDHRDFHDIPCVDVTLSGENFETKDVFASEAEGDKKAGRSDRLHPGAPQSLVTGGRVIRLRASREVERCSGLGLLRRSPA